LHDKFKIFDLGFGEVSKFFDIGFKVFDFGDPFDLDRDLGS